jgi:hypothetical protein
MRCGANISLLAVLIVFPLLGDPQVRRSTMSGIVTDKQTFMPVEGATVTVVGSKANPAITDVNGSFILRFTDDVHDGDTILIHVEKSGYKVYQALKSVSSTITLQVPLEAVGPRQRSRLAPAIESTIETRIIGCLHARAPAPPQGQTAIANFSFQEIFYEWTVTVKANRQAVASLKADYLQESDIFRVEPEGATAERVPESPLEFKTSDGSKPAHYALIVKSDDLSETQSLTVTIRRPINAPLADSDLIKLAYIRSPTGKIKQSDYDTNADVDRLKRQAKTIAEWKHAPRTTPLPIHPPGDVPLGAIDSAVEVWCKDEECKELMVGNLVANWNRFVPVSTMNSAVEDSARGARPEQATGGGTDAEPIRPHLQTRLVIDSVQDADIDFHIEVENISRWQVDALRSGMRTPDVVDLEVSAPLPPTLPPGGHLAIAGLPGSGLRRHGILFLELNYTSDIQGKPSKFISKYSFLVRPVDMKPQALLPTTWQEQAGEVLGPEQQSAEESMKVFGGPQGTMFFALPVRRPDGSPNLLVMTNDKRKLSFDGAARSLSFTIRTRAGALKTINYPLPEGSYEAIVVGCLWDDQKDEVKLIINGKLFP